MRECDRQDQSCGCEPGHCEAETTSARTVKSRGFMARWQRPVSMMLAIGGLAGLLWLKLRIVSGLPKTAYAVPKATPAPDTTPPAGAKGPAHHAHQTAHANDPQDH